VAEAVYSIGRLSATAGIAVLIDKLIDNDPNEALASADGSSALLDSELPEKRRRTEVRFLSIGSPVPSVGATSIFPSDVGSDCGGPQQLSFARRATGRSKFQQTRRSIEIMEESSWRQQCLKRSTTSAGGFSVLRP
jgi:hypothetical protein